MSGFWKDFSTGCSTLLIIAAVVFIIIPLILLIFKVALWLVFPIIFIAAIVLGVALFGRFISSVKKHW
jgi:hypothetical protein